MSNSSACNRAKDIRLLLLDVDGVLSDGKLYYSADGGEIKTFHSQDGHGIKILRKTGVEVGIITGRTSAIVERRVKELGITLFKQGREDKFSALNEMREDFPVSLEHIAFMGDDWPDLLVMTRVGLAMTVANGHASVLEHAHWRAERDSGEGAVREACDFIMQSQGTFEAALNSYIAPSFSNRSTP